MEGHRVRRQRSSTTKTKQPEPLERIQPNAAGIDCGSRHHHVAVPVDRDPEPVRRFKTFRILSVGIVRASHDSCNNAMPRAGGLGARRMSRVDVFRMIKRRVKAIGLGEANCHTFRATGITAYLLNGGPLERAQRIAAHESPHTTMLYDRTADEVTVEDIENIGI